MTLLTKYAIIEAKNKKNLEGESPTLRFVLSQEIDKRSMKTFSCKSILENNKILINLSFNLFLVSKGVSSPPIKC